MLDLTKPVQTRDGRKVRILCVDYKNSYPVVTIRENHDGTEVLSLHKIDGSYISQDRSSNNDLINVPQRHKHADAIIAWANGAEIQCRWAGSNDPWSIKTHHEWKADCEYRVKPE